MKPKYTAQDFIDAGISRDVAIQFMAHRKELKAPCTRIAINRIESEARMASMTLEQAMIMMMEEGWRGFKAEWVKPRQVTLSDDFLSRHTDTSWAH